MGTLNYQLLDLALSKNFQLIREKELLIWGAAEKGFQIKNTLTHLGIEIEAFCDSDIHKWGNSYDKIPIISPYEFSKKYNRNTRVCIISCIFRENELLRLLEELGIDNISLISYWGIKNACIANGIVLEVQDNLPTYDKIWQYKKRNYIRERFGFSLDSLARLETYESNVVWGWQPGKVASTTIKKRLYQSGIPCLHMHTLNYPSHALGESLKEIWTQKIEEKLSQKIKIITSVREPLTRDYSAFWQPFKMERTYLMSVFNKDFQKMYENYTNLILNGYENTCNLLQEATECVWLDEFEWFDKEIKKILGIDIYEYPFNREKGYEIIQSKNIQIFIFKVEKLDNLMPELSSFLGKKIQSGENDNKATDASYWLAYNKLKNELKLPQEYVEHYYKNNPYMNHFYTKDEQELFLSKWKTHIKRGD